jgi:uncharacterized protein (DUF1330 family)
MKEETMPAYVVVEARVHDRDRFAAYARRVPEIVAQYGGEYLALGGAQEVLEGDWGESRVVLHRWPDAASARRFWESPEYVEAKALRAGTGEFRVILVEGLAEETLEGGR